MFRLFARVRKKGTAKKSSEKGRLTLWEIFSGKRRNEVEGIAWWALTLFIIAACWPHTAGNNALGPVGEIFFRSGYAVFGILIYFLPVMTLFYGFIKFKGQDIERRPFKVLGLVLAVLTLTILVELIHPAPISFNRVNTFYAWEGATEFWEKVPKSLQLWGTVSIPAGGLIAHVLTALLVTIVSTVGTYIVCGTVFIISLYFLEAEPYVAALIKRLTERIQIVIKNIRQALAGHFGYAVPRAENKPHCQTESTSPESVSARLLTKESERPKIKITTPPSVLVVSAEREKVMATEKSKSESGKCAGAKTKSQEITAKTGQDNRSYELPELALLADPRPNETLSEQYFERMSQTLENALGQFGVAAKVLEVCPGPVVTRYELQPSPGVKVNRIISLADDIALAMKAAHVRIEAPIPGKGAVGIEIPNQEKQVVVLKEFVAHQEYQKSDSILTFAVGKDIGGKHIFAQLENMPHLLIAGATGSGKSACINSIISSLLFRVTPHQVRFLMIDPKRVELTVYNGIPHLKSPVITDSREAAVALKLMVGEMEDRYKKFAEMGVRDITAYNQRIKDLQAEAKDSNAELDSPPASIPLPMPYIVIFIDELADLMMVSANEVENTIARLAQMARGVGIHMVLATQRPSVDVITGVIKANFPSRIAFQVSSKVDSRTILDANGADALLGRGDMLYAPASANKPLRIQGVFITTKEVEEIVKFWKRQGTPVFDPAFSGEKLKAAGTVTEGGGEEDELFQQAVSWVLRAKQASTSMLQRRLKVGYSRAARLLDLMEEKGIVGPPEGSKPRKVLIQPEETGGLPDKSQEDLS